LPTRRERYLERKKQLIDNLEHGFGFVKEEIDLALHVIAKKYQKQPDDGMWFMFEGPFVDEMFLTDYYSDISRVAYEILFLYNNPSLKQTLLVHRHSNDANALEEIFSEILETQEIFHGDLNKSLMYLSNIDHMNLVFNCPRKLIQEAFMYFNFDVS
jgi:hypothetical protein